MKTKTIEERAKEFSIRLSTDVLLKSSAQYASIAQKQQEIDIECACEWLDEHLYDYLTSDGPMEQYYIKQNDLIKDFKQVMKGE